MQNKKTLESVDLDEAGAILTHRKLIQIEGQDAFSFLQGLITNDLTKLSCEQDNCIYTAFLNARGKYLTDAFVIKINSNNTISYNNCFLIDVEADHLDTFLETLKVYKLRSKVTLTFLENYYVYCLPPSISNIDLPLSSCVEGKEFMVVPDPRNYTLGHRIYSSTFLACPNTVEVLHRYKTLLISNLVANGSQVIPYERGFILEYGFDRLQAVDYTKGCYVGQELTARMHHLKMAKRDLMYMDISADVQLKVNSHLLGYTLYSEGIEFGKVLDQEGSLILIHGNISFFESHIICKESQNSHQTLKSIKLNHVSFHHDKEVIYPEDKLNFINNLDLIEVYDVEVWRAFIS